MFKKTEDSEWSRFSKALSNQPKAGADEQVVEEEVPELAPQLQRDAAPTPATQPAPPIPAAPAAPRPAQSLPSFARQHQPAPQPEVEETETVIGPRSFLDGTLKCESNVRIKGTAQGEISSSKSVIIEESASVNAKVSAANAVVAGKLEGSIECDGRLEILATGKVSGELTAGVLIIQEGAFFEGHLKMKDRKGEEQSED